MGWNLIPAIAAGLVEFFLSSKLAKFAGALAIFTMYIGLVVAFIAAAYGLLLGLTAAAPESITFALAFLPPSAPAMIGAFYATLAMKRILDYKKQLFDYVADPVLARVEGGLASRGNLPKRR